MSTEGRTLLPDSSRDQINEMFCSRAVGYATVGGNVGDMLLSPVIRQIFA